MPPSLPHELISIIAGHLHPAAWNTARALSVVYRDAVHEVTKRPEALGNLLAAMEFANCPPAYLYYDGNDEHVQANRDRFRVEVEEDPNLLSTLRWVMLRMADRVRFAGFNVERNSDGANTQFQPLLWEWK